MARVQQYLRNLVPNGRVGVYFGSSAIVFLVGLMIGLYLSDTTKGTSDGLKGTDSATAPWANKKTPENVKWELVPSASTNFDGSKVDTSVWDLYDGPGHAGVGFRRANAISVESGNLRIKATGDVSGGMSQKFSQVYGRWEVRARVEQGNGYGPAILLWPESERWPDDGEIDFAEIPKGDRRMAYMTVHWGPSTDHKEVSADIAGDWTQWHEFAVDWLPDRLVFYVDGVEKFRLTEPAQIPRKPMHLAMQLDMGKCNDNWWGCRDETTPESVSFYADSVKVYRPLLNEMK